jgi:hypothetical protein
MTQWRGKLFFAPRATKQSSCRTLLAGLSRGLAMLGNKNVENPWKSSTTPRCGRCIVAQLSAVLFARRSSSAIARMAEDCEARQHQRPGRRLTDVSLEPVFPSDLDGAQRARHNEIRRRVRRARPIAAANAAADKIPLVLRPSLPPGARILSDTTFVNEVNSAMSRSTHIRACERPTGTILPRRRSCCSARYSCPPAQARCCPAPALPAQGFFCTASTARERFENNLRQLSLKLGGHFENRQTEGLPAPTGADVGRVATGNPVEAKFTASVA